MTDRTTSRTTAPEQDDPTEPTDRPNPLVASEFGLTEQQGDAMALDRHLAVTAAAGTGKTTALAARYLHILQQTDATPEEIATITFTRKATTEMRDRIRENVTAQLGAVDDDEFDRWRSIADDLADGYIHTIDAFCARLLREYAVEAGIDPGFDMLDEVDAPVLQREAITNYLDQNTQDRDLGLVARLWKRDTVIELLRGLLTARPESTMWARDRLDQSRETHIIELFEVFAEVDPVDARAMLSNPEMQGALSTLRSLNLEELGVPRDDYAWENIELYLRPAAENGGATDPDGADDLEVLRTLRRLADGIAKADGDPYEKARGRGSHHIAGKKGNWPDAEQEAYRDALEVLIETLSSEYDAIKTIPSQIDENAAPYTGALARVYLDCLETYEDLKAERTAFDFNDLLTKALELIESDATIRETLQERFAHIMVDEFQDTDPQQWQLVSLLSGIADPDRALDDEATVFVVGDKKQSIYRFRGADVATFSAARADLVESNTARDGIVAVDDGTEPPTELELTGSFRTLTEPIETLNPLFEQVFQSTSETYRPYEAEPQSIDPQRGEGTDIEGTVEYLVVPEEEAATEELYDSDHPLCTRTYLGKGDREAHALAVRISAHFDAQTEVFDSESKEYRPAQPRDVAILLRTRKNLAAYERAFGEYDIPVNVISGDGYWETSEIRMLYNLIEVLFDPTQDIPLYGLLRSPMFGLTDTKIAPYAADGQLWTAMADADDDAIVDAYRRLRDWREAYGIEDDSTTSAVKEGHGDTAESETKGEYTSPYVTVNKLLTTVFEETGILASLATDERGQQAVANVQKFQEQVRQWNDQGVRTLAGIRDRITNQQAESAKERDAALPAETGGVRILTVHASKGLEFPIVAVPEIGRRFNFDGSLDDHKQAYLGTYPSESTSNRYLGLAGPGIADTYEIDNTAVKDALRSRDKEELRAEEKRTLYVACTRVRDHLLLSGTHGIKMDYSGGDPTPQFEPPAEHDEASCWRDWVQPALFGTETDVFEQLRAGGSVDSPVEGAGEYTIRTAPASVNYDGADETDPGPVERSLELPSTPASSAYSRRLTATTFVNELDQALIETGGFEPPAWHREEAGPLLRPPVDDDSARGTTFGTLIHRVCEFGPYDSTEDRRSVTDRVIASEGIEFGDQQTEYLDAHVERGLRVQASFINHWDAGTVRRELPVRLQIDETTIVGEIDLLVVTDDAYHILDYKTNRVTDPESALPELCRHYRPQMEAYAAALQRDDPTRSVSATLYFTAADTARQLRFDAGAPPVDPLSRYVKGLVNGAR